MQTLKVKNALKRLSKARTVPAKFLRQTEAFAVNSEVRECSPQYESDEHYSAYQLEAERMKAKAEEFAQHLRQRLV